jgi:predicted XRE-type DNA-binding protein
MKKGTHIQSELEALGASALSAMPKAMPYILPDQYFELMHRALSANIHIDEEQAWSKKMPFATPSATYFEQLQQQIISQVRATSEEHPKEWSKANPYWVPQGYFEQLAQSTLNRIKKQLNHTPKRIPLFRNVQLAAAIAMIVFVGFGVVQFKQKPANELSKISSAEISEYVSENIDDFDTDLILNALVKSGTKLDVKLSKEDVTDYLNESGWN